MKYYSRLGQYKASNVTLNTAPLWATSYGYWYFLKRIDGKLVWNDYPYSTTTQAHQRKVMLQLRSMGIEPDIVVTCPRGLQELESGANYAREMQSQVLDSLGNPRRKKRLDESRLTDLEKWEARESDTVDLIRAVETTTST